jgi:hypothetical protein
MSSPSRGCAATPALVIHDAAPLLLAIYAPIFCLFSTAGQAMAAALVGIAALSALVWRLTMGRAPSVIPTALHLPALALVAITVIAVPFSNSLHGSLLELSRLIVGVLLLVLVANRALLPASPAVPVAALVAVSVVVLPFVRIIGEGDIALDVLATVAVTAVIACLLTTQQQPDPVRRWVEALLFCAGLTVGLYSLREKIVTSYMMEPRNPSWQVFSTFFNPNNLGGFIAMLLPIVSAWRSPRRRGERLLWAVRAVARRELVPTNSRAQDFALAVALVVYGVLLATPAAGRGGTWRWCCGTLGAVMVGCAAVLAVSGPIRHTVLAELSQQSASNMFRILTWKGTLRMVLDNPGSASARGPVAST